MGLDDPSADTQSQPTTARAPGGIYLVEPFEDVRQMDGGDADTRIRHPEDRAVPGAIDGEGDRSPRFREPDGVVEQIGDELPQPGR